MSKKIFKLCSVIMCLMFLIVSFMGCQAPNTPSASSSASTSTSVSVSQEPVISDASAETPKKMIKIAMCLEVPFIDFFVPTRIGAMDAAKEYGVDLVWQGPETADITKLLSIIETQIDAGVDGIAIQAGDPNALKTAVDKAKAKGIPVMIFNNTMEYEGFDGFVGMQPEVAGKAIGDQIVNILSGKSEWSKKMGIADGATVSGKIAYLTDLPGAYNLEGRIKGIRDVLAAYPEIKDLGMYDCTTQGMAKSKEVVENIITANPDIRVIAAAASGATAAAGLVVQEKKMESKTLVIGMDLLTQTLQLVKDGIIPVAVGQDPYNQGYLPVKFLAEKILNGKEIPKVTSTEVEIVTSANVDEIIKREADYLAAGTKLGK